MLSSAPFSWGAGQPAYLPVPSVTQKGASQPAGDRKKARGRAAVGPVGLMSKALTSCVLHAPLVLVINLNSAWLLYWSVNWL